MREPWIRVHANLHKKNVAVRLSALCKDDVFKACGHLITFWSGVAENCLNGYIGEATDAQIETWAGWSQKRGDRGKFAAWVRRHHMDEDGRVPEWDDYMGALETRREEDRQRKQLARLRRKSAGQSVGQSVGHPADCPQDVRTTSAPARADGDGDGTVRSTSPPPPARAREVSRATDGERAFLTAVPADRRQTWELIIASWYSGQNYPQGRAADPRDVSAGLLEYLASATTLDFGARHVRSFVINSEARRLAGALHDPRREPPRSQRRNAGNVADETEANALAAALTVQAIATRRAPS